MKTRTFPSALLMLTAAILILPAVADDQRQHGLKPDIITFSALISACEKGKRLEQAWELF